MTAICMLTIVFDSRAVLSLFNERSRAAEFFTSNKNRNNSGPLQWVERNGAAHSHLPNVPKKGVVAAISLDIRLFFVCERREPAGYPRHLGPPTHAGRWSDQPRQRTTTG